MATGMKYQNPNDKEKEIAQMLKEEAETHNKEYKDRYNLPFRSDSYEIDVNSVISASDYAYKSNRFISGYRRKRLFELIDLDELSDKQVLDVGCGNGQYAVFFGMHGATVHGFDISRKGVEIGRKTAEKNGVSDRVHFSTQSATDLSFKDGSFDLIVCNAVLHHLMKYEGFESELYRVLADGGQLVFADGIRDNPVYNTGRWLFRKVGGRQPLGDVDVEYTDYRSFVEKYDDVYIERFTLFSGIKQLFKQVLHKEEFSLPIRSLLFVTKKLDDGILRVIPSAERFCLEIVGSMRKKRT